LSWASNHAVAAWPNEVVRRCDGCGAIYHRACETDRSPEEVLVIAVCNLLDSDVALFPSIAGRHANTARPVARDSATGKGSCGFQELAPRCHIALVMLTP